MVFIKDTIHICDVFTSYTYLLLITKYTQIVLTSAALKLDTTG
jgi:hypothetical protein